MGVIDPNPAFMNNRCGLVLARMYAWKGPRPDPNEVIHVETAPLADIPDLIKKGEITHSLWCLHSIITTGSSGFRDVALPKRPAHVGN